MAVTEIIHSITDLSGNTHPIQGILYGKCETAAATQAKAVSIPGITSLAEGLSIRVRFVYAQTYKGTPTLNVNSLGAKTIRRASATNAAQYEWVANEILDLVYDGTYWVIIDGGLATTTYYGVTKLYNGSASTNTGYSLVPAALNSFSENVVTGIPAYSSSATYAVGDRVRYSNSMYECNTAITTAEAWTADHWTELPSVLEMVENLPGAEMSLTIPANGWSGTAPYTYTWSNAMITSDVGVKVEFLSTSENDEILYIEYEKVSGGVQFTAPSLPETPMSVIVRIFTAPRVLQGS